jgi:serine/threonine-protein kinase
MDQDRTEFDDLASDLTGRRLGAYTLIRRLGRGGMADVYLAEQSSLRRHVAIKILKPSLAKNESFVKRFHHEAQAAAALVQANIVQIYEVGTTDGLHFIAQEYVRGQNLRQYLNRYGAVEPIVAVNIIRQVAAALQKAAELHVIHRDIKPENILLAPNGEVRVADFGLARINDPQRRSDLTQIGITMGTPLYMSPEQVEGKDVDPRSDIYSLGITAYHMLAGRPPFDGDTPLAVALQHVNKIPTPLAQHRPDVPPQLVEIVEKMIAKAPADRFQDPAELSRAIRKIEIDFDQWDQLVEKLSSEVLPIEGHLTAVTEAKYAVTRQLQTIMSGPIRSDWTRPRYWILLAGLGLIAFLGGSVWAWMQPPPNPFGGARGEQVPMQKDARAQYNYAFWNPELEERGWEAVGRYFGAFANGPDGDKISATDLYYLRLADERLAELYVEKLEYPKAEPIYRRLTNVESTEKSFIAVGQVGLAVVGDALGKPESEIRQHLFDAEQLNVAELPVNQFIREHYRRLRGKYLPTSRPD